MSVEFPISHYYIGKNGRFNNKKKNMCTSCVMFDVSLLHIILLCFRTTEMTYLYYCPVVE